MKVIDVISALDAVFPLSTQDDWDNSGLIVGHPDEELTGVLLTVDITLERVQEAISKGCNMIVAHHPILFRGLKRLNGTTDEQKTIELAIRHNVALCAFHTPADKSSQGLSYALGKIIGLSDMHTFIPSNDGQNVGYGVVGTMSEAMPTEAFLAMLSHLLSCKCIRHNQYSGQVKRVAICTGSGSEFIADALHQKADAYITADVKYHQFQQPDGHMLIADIGHYESEEMSKKLFLDILTERFAEKNSNFALCMSDTCGNVIKYYTE